MKKRIRIKNMKKEKCGKKNKDIRKKTNNVKIRKRKKGK